MLPPSERENRLNRIKATEESKNRINTKLKVSMNDLKNFKNFEQKTKFYQILWTGIQSFLSKELGNIRYTWKICILHMF